MLLCIWPSLLSSPIKLHVYMSPHCSVQVVMLLRGLEVDNELQPGTLTFIADMLQVPDQSCPVNLLLSLYYILLYFLKVQYGVQSHLT